MRNWPPISLTNTRDGSYRLLYAARIGDCRSCPLRSHCQESSFTTKPRRVSAVFWPVSSNQAVSSAPVPELPEPKPRPPEPLPLSPVLWGDWERCQIRRRWLKGVRTETVELATRATQAQEPSTKTNTHVFTRAQRAHWRLTWDEWFARNARPSTASPLEVTIHGLPTTFANLFGFGLANVA